MGARNDGEFCDAFFCSFQILLLSSSALGNGRGEWNEPLPACHLPLSPLFSLTSILDTLGHTS